MDIGIVRFEITAKNQNGEVVYPEHIAKGYEMLALACHSLGEWKQGREYEERRGRIGTLDVASAFDVHL